MAKPADLEGRNMLTVQDVESRHAEYGLVPMHPTRQIVEPVEAHRQRQTQYERYYGSLQPARNAQVGPVFNVLRVGIDARLRVMAHEREEQQEEAAQPAQAANNRRVIRAQVVIDGV